MTALVIGVACVSFIGGVGQKIITAEAAPQPKSPDAIQRVIDLAKKQEGISDHGTNRTVFGKDFGADGVPWCAEFVWWVFDRGAAGSALPVKSAGVYGLMEAFKKAGRFSQDPQVGDVVIYSYGQGHTGLVTGFDDKTITTVEGNTSKGKGSQDEGDVVAIKTRQRDSQIVGYGHPDWSASIFKTLSSPYNDLFLKEGEEHGVAPILLAAMAKQESGFNPNASSGAGARGLMQIMPETAKSLGVNPNDPIQAVDGASRMMKGLLDKYKTTELALAAYNAGPGNVDKYGGLPPFTETQNYVRNITESMRSVA